MWHLFSTLTGRHVKLEPLAESHRKELRVVADDERIWVHTLTDARGVGFDLWFNNALAANEVGWRVPYAVRSLPDGALVGSTSYLDISMPDKRIEIGSTWYHPSVWGTTVNPDCKLLLLSFAFEVLGVNRVALVTDALNLRSQAAIAKLGAVKEGVIRSHRITEQGRVRDTVLYSILASEWPTVRSDLLVRLSGGKT